jgi:Fe-S cluster assembly protein SufD
LTTSLPFSPDVSAALDGPAWLRTARVEAAERFAAASLPSTEEEIWRYSRIAELDLDALHPVDAATVVTLDGAAPAAAGLEVREVDERDADLVLALLEEPTDQLAELNAAFTRPLLVRLRPGATIAAPLMVEHRLADAAGASFPRLIVEVGEDAELTVVERFTSSDGRGLVAPVTHLRADASARLRYLAVNELGQEVWQIGSQVARGDRDSRTVLANVALGGDYARIRTDARLVGRGAEGEQVGVYFGEGRQMHDFRTLQDHAAPKTRSNLLFKGALQGHALSVYTGLIKVRKEARGTDAFQTNRNLKLSEHAWAESVPNLDIETNDVRCSHASTVGPIDEEQRFYLESRGIPPAVAERLVVLGFFSEVLGRLPAPALLPGLVAQVAAKLDRRDVEADR